MFKKRFLLLMLTLSMLFIPSYIQANKQNRQSLMIVAHPDDETIFAGHEILNNSYFIVCITNGDNKKRKVEFEKMLAMSHNEGVMLSYPDKTNGVRDTWKTCFTSIEKDIQYYASLKKWDKVVTHNPKGEYGHIHHKMVNEIVTKTLVNKKQQSKLFYFQPYFKKTQVSSYAPTLSKQEQRAKKALYSAYPSQDKVINKLKHIEAYEKLIPYIKKDTIFQ